MANERKLFGTDGIRGPANIYPMTGEIAMSLGRAVTSYFQKNKQNRKPLIILGKDTRLSCYMLELAFSAGVCSQGGNVILTGPFPTAGVAFVTHSMRADAGVMISASHNQFFDNGIKIFDRTGHKLPDEIELQLEQMIFNPKMIEMPRSTELGKARRLDEVHGRYIVHAKAALSSQYSLEGLRLVVDCANGAAYKLAPMIFDELGAEVITIGVTPSGKNINKDCGSLHPQHCAEAVKTYRADMGICLDGDADRVTIIDEHGEIVAGDKILGICARFLKENNELGNYHSIVGTVMTNLGLEHYLDRNAISLARTQVGDRYIVEEMKHSGALFGGEPSGHLIFKKYSTTGDGILAALKVIEAAQYFQKTISQLASDIELFPQITKNVEVHNKIPLEKLENLQKQIKEVEKTLGKSGRVLIRYSGTEPLARVMIEGEDEMRVQQFCLAIADTLKKELKT